MLLLKKDVFRYVSNIVSRAKMEHGGKMEHRVFWKKLAWCGSIFTSIWFLSSASSASHVEIKLPIDHVLRISQKRNFTRLINQFTRVLTSIALTNYVVEPLHVIKYNFVPLVLIFISFDWATGDIIVHIMAFPQTQSRGQNGTWYVGAKWHCGAKWNGAKWHHSILSPKVFHCAPMPWSVLPHGRSTYENFSAESD